MCFSTSRFLRHVLLGGRSEFCLQKLDELQKHVTAMCVDCDQAEAQLQLTTEASNTLLERAGSLRNERCMRTICGLYNGSDHLTT